MNPILQVKTRLDTKIEPQDSEALQMIKDLRSTAFDTGSPSPKNNTRYAQDYKKLGFDSHLDPSLDFQVTPPGILALDCMDHFAKTHQEQFMKVVLENSCRSDNHECPFAKSSIELVRQLADLLGVGKAEDPNCKQYHEMFFKSEHPFEEFFCHCVIQLNKTWRDMRATKEDFNKVFDVVVEQIEGSLNPKEAKEVRPKTFEQFRQNVKSYLDISRKWQADARNRDIWTNSAPVTELKAHLEPEIKELIRQQRSNFMVEGTRFQKYKKSGEEVKGQFRYVKLHPNHKTIYVGEWNSDKSVPTIEDLEPWMQISDLELFTKGDCQFIKNMKKESERQKTLTSLALSLQLQEGGENTSLDLIAPDKQTYNYWEDGIKCLKQMEMCSDDYKNEMLVLLDMEVKLRLLDLEGVDLPETAPTVASISMMNYHHMTCAFRFLHHHQTSTSPPADTGLAPHSSKRGLTLLILAPHSSKGGLTLLIESSNPLLDQCCVGGSIALSLSPDCAFDFFIIHLSCHCCPIF